MSLKNLLAGPLAAVLLLSGCGGPAQAEAPVPTAAGGDAVTLTLSDDAVQADGSAVPAEDDTAAVYTARDIVYYEAGHDFTYGEGTAADEHTAQEAEAHTVVHIAQPGTYVIRGSLSQGQIAVDLGEDAVDDPEAVVTLVLDGADITCTVAPAVIFYNVYECDPEGESGSEPDLTAAGARVVIADGSENHIAGSYVARIYKSYTLSEDGASVTDSKKLHKYDGAFYSKMSMSIDGGPEGTGLLDIEAENEGLDTEMHLAINGGNIRITSGNDGINCNEDDVSVIALNGGTVRVNVAGGTGEGDGIDSNGWLVLRGGVVSSSACGRSADAGLDAEKGILLEGGTAMAAGNMLDAITEGEQVCAIFTFSQPQSGGTRYSLVGQSGGEVLGFAPDNDFTVLVLSSPALTAGEEYSLYAGEQQLALSASMTGGMGPGAGQHGGHKLPDGARPADGQELPDDARQGQAFQRPEGVEPGRMPTPDSTPPALSEDAQPPADDAQPPADDAQPQPPADAAGGAESSVLFSLAAGVNTFTVTQ